MLGRRALPAGRIAALQEHWRVYSDSYSNVGWNKAPGGTIQ